MQGETKRRRRQSHDSVASNTSHLDQCGVLCKLRAGIHELLEVQIQVLKDKVYALLAVDDIV
jgi:hypothetical protein